MTTYGTTSRIFLQLESLVQFFYNAAAHGADARLVPIPYASQHFRIGRLRLARHTALCVPCAA